MVVIFPPLVSQCPEGAGSDWTVSLLLFPIPMWPFLYILSCRKPVLGLQVILRDSYCICSHSFSVFLGGGELRVFLLCNLDQTLPGDSSVQFYIHAIMSQFL